MNVFRDKCFQVFNIFPHSGICGSTPSPRKLKLLVAMTALPIVNVAFTIIGASELGTICLNIIDKSDEPSARAESTNS